MVCEPYWFAMFICQPQWRSGTLDDDQPSVSVRRASYRIHLLGGQRSGQRLLQGNLVSAPSLKFSLFKSTEMAAIIGLLFGASDRYSDLVILFADPSLSDCYDDLICHITSLFKIQSGLIYPFKDRNWFKTLCIC